MSDDKVVQNAMDYAEYAYSILNYYFAKHFLGVEESRIEPRHQEIYQSCKNIIDNNAAINAVPDGAEPIKVDVEVGKTQFTHKYLEGWEKNWNKEIGHVEDLIFAITLNPEKKHLAADVQDIVETWRTQLKTAKELLAYYCVSDDDKPVEEVTMDEKQRRREERRKRMQQFTGEA